MEGSPRRDGFELAGDEHPRVTVATYTDYESAQRAVDFLSDHDFPVNRASIIGTDVRLVEQVLGRLTTLRATLLGAAAGAWFGLLIGLLIGIFAESGWWAVVFTGLVAGAIWGAAFGGISHAVTGGRRDFASRRSLEAARYAINVDSEYSEEASRLLAKLT